MQKTRILIYRKLAFVITGNNIKSKSSNANVVRYATEKNQVLHQ